MLGETEMLRLVQAAQCCTEREYVDYNPPQKAHRSTDWERTLDLHPRITDKIEKINL